MSGCAAPGAPEITSEGFERLVKVESDDPLAVWELSSRRNPVQSAAITEEGTYLATIGDLYRMQPSEDATPEPVATSVDPETRLVLAPGGEVYAWLRDNPIPAISGDDTGSLERIIEVERINGTGLVTLGTLGLTTANSPLGYDTIYMGYQGRLIVTASPLENWEGEGAHRYIFWMPQGNGYVIANEAVYPQSQLGFLEPCGRAFVLLGENDSGEESAKLFGWNGEEFERLPEVPGSFRNAEVARSRIYSGWNLLLNPALREEAPHEIYYVYLYDSYTEQTRQIEFPMPIHDLVAAPDGLLVAVVGEFNYYLFDPNEIVSGLESNTEVSIEDLPHRQVDLREMISQPFRISDLIFSGPVEETVSVLYWDEQESSDLPYGGSIFSFSNQSLRSSHELDISVQTAFVPRSDTSYGSGQFVAYTEDSVILVDSKSSGESDDESSGETITCN